MKKRINQSLITNKKNNVMINRNLPGKKKDTYIYTEADLGEGILEEGINPSYYATTNDFIEDNILRYNIMPTEFESKNYGLEIVNVEDDFNYSYYLWVNIFRITTYLHSDNLFTKNDIFVEILNIFVYHKFKNITFKGLAQFTISQG